MTAKSDCILQHVAGTGATAVFELRTRSSALDAVQTQQWLAAATDVFEKAPQICSLSVVPAASAAGTASGSVVDGPAIAPGLCFLNGRCADLIGFPTEESARTCTIDEVEQWSAAATLKGLRHLWAVGDANTSPRIGLATAPQTTSAPPLVSASDAESQAIRRRGIAVGIDAAWLLGDESGAQVYVFSMVEALSRRAEISRVVLLSESGGVPAALKGIAKISGQTWRDAVAAGQPLDVIHRPYQPGEDVDFARYRRVAACVAISALDFIAYDNPSYHESALSWRKYRRIFDRQIGQADCVFAISRYIGDRLQRQFAHRLAGPVRVIYPGTDHLSSGTAAAGIGPEVAALAGTPFMLVLGNDFAHKNRDFAVKVFCEMRRRGYDGRLVLAGYRLDTGSSRAYELAGAGACADHVIRMGTVPPADKRWLIQHAQVLLYPTSSEGFGLVPFEGAALGTPTAFVRFGPLQETLPGVAAAAAWHVPTFTDHVFALLANPQRQIEQIRAASGRLSWTRSADETVAAYVALLSESAPWRMTQRAEPGVGDYLGDWWMTYADRAARRMQRMRSALRPRGEKG